MKKQREKKTSVLSSFFSGIAGSLFSSLQDNVMMAADMFFDKIQQRILRLQRKMIQHVLVFAAIALGVLFLLISLMLYLIDGLHLPRYAVFLIGGVALLLIASIASNLWRE
jgi:hypothetical protein